MQTRRVSKRLSSTAASTEGDAESSAMAIDAPATASATETIQTLSIPEDIDVSALQTLLPGLDAVNPSPDSIIALYRTILQQASIIEELSQERDSARAEASRFEVELDQALQDQEIQTTQIKSNLEEVQNELAEVKRQKEQLGKPFPNLIILTGTNK